MALAEQPGQAAQAAPAAPAAPVCDANGVCYEYTVPQSRGTYRGVHDAACAPAESKAFVAVLAFPWLESNPCSVVHSRFGHVPHVNGFLEVAFVQTLLAACGYDAEHETTQDAVVRLLKQAGVPLPQPPTLASLEDLAAQPARHPQDACAVRLVLVAALPPAMSQWAEVNQWRARAVVPTDDADWRTWVWDSDSHHTDGARRGRRWGSSGAAQRGTTEGREDAGWYVFAFSPDRPLPHFAREAPPTDQGPYLVVYSLVPPPPAGPAASSLIATRTP
jgi:hypothetical protein